MKILFAGTPDFAVPVLESVAGKYDVCVVLTAPDKPQGRGKSLGASPVGQKARELAIPLLTPVVLDESFIQIVKTFNPELLVVAAYGKIFKDNFLSLFPFGGINLHPSLLPRYRGPAPIPAMIIAGETKVGITVQRLARKMDSGDILLQEQFPLTRTATTDSVSLQSSIEGARMVLDVLDGLRTDTIVGTPQNESDATYCSLIKKEDGLIDWKESAVLIERKVRAYFSWPKAYTFFQDKQLSIAKSCVKNDVPHGSYLDVPAGGVVGIDKESGILVKTGDGILGINRLQLQMKREMDFTSFFNGNKAIVNSVLGETHVG